MSQWKRIRGAWVHTGKPVGFAATPPRDPSQHEKDTTDPPPPGPPPPGLGISERELMLGPRKSRK